MWRHFFTFELRYWFRGWMLWIFLLVIALMIFGAVSTDEIRVGGSLGNTNRNAPFVIENYYAIVCLLTLLMTTAFANSAAARDFASNTDQIIFTKPIRKFDFLAGRFLGAAFVSVIPILGVSIGVLLAKYMPWVDADRFGPVNWTAHLSGILVFAIPNTLFIAAVLFSISALTRSTALSFLAALLLLTGYGVAGALTSDIRNETLGSLVDPFAIGTYAIATKYWTVAEKNTLAIGFHGLLLWNRLLWLAVGGVILCLSGWRFSFLKGAGRRKKAKAIAPDVAAPLIEAVTAHPEFGIRSRLSQFLRIGRTEFTGLVKTTSFLVILAAALLNTIPNIILSASEGFGDVSLPVTYHMVEIIEGALYLFLVAMITYFAGVLVWKERDTGIDEIQDSLPYPEWLAYAAKFSALVLAMVVIQLLIITSAVLTQTFSHYYRFQLGLYASELLGVDLSLLIFLAILAFFCHAISPNKYIGYAVYLVFLIFNLFAWNALHVSSHMVMFASHPSYKYSDFYGYAPYLTGLLWFTAYWACFCGLLGVATILAWRRGKETGWRHRLHIARSRFRGPVLAAAAGFALAFLFTGAVIFYNTKILHHVVTANDTRNIAADYEKTYKRYKDIPQPRITEIHYTIDLWPETRNAVMGGDEVVKNQTSGAIDELHVSVADNLETNISMSGATLKVDDRRLRYRIYHLSPPLAPGESRHLQFTVKTSTRGFENELTNQEVMQNGTFFNNTVAPQIGYQTSSELEDKNQRKKRGLPQKDLMPALERNCVADCRDSYLSNNSDLVSVDSVISTAPDQIAIAPGSLIREWNQNGRRYFHYRLDHPAWNFYSFLSARYAVARQEWNGMSVEVYYLKEHSWNVPKMLNSIRRSFEYYTANFSPYTQKQARIIEFPRVASFAQAFPGTMPYSESIGFIADLKNPDDIDKVFYVVAHEMGHQWWAYQVLGADMQGATALSETLAQYSALMVMEKEYGRDMMRKFMKYEMDGYLRARGREQLKERPLLTVESGQGYIHYNKGSAIMYYLREMIGEDAVNRALRKVLAEHAYQAPPYPVSWALVDALHNETPPQLQYLMKDLFEDITVFSNRTLAARAKKRPDGKYDVTIEVEARKFKADAQGNEREVPVDDWIEIGAFAAPPKGKKYGQVLYRDKVHMAKPGGTYTFTVSERPDKAGIDPLLLMIDRIPDDNLKNVAVEGG